jgi:hypothetical protein
MCSQASVVVNVVGMFKSRRDVVNKLSRVVACRETLCHFSQRKRRQKKKYGIGPLQVNFFWNFTFCQRNAQTKPVGLKDTKDYSDARLKVIYMPGKHKPVSLKHAQTRHDISHEQ